MGIGGVGGDRNHVWIVNNRIGTTLGKCLGCELIAIEIASFEGEKQSTLLYVSGISTYCRVQFKFFVDLLD